MANKAGALHTVVLPDGALGTRRSPRTYTHAVIAFSDGAAYHAFRKREYDRGVEINADYYARIGKEQPPFVEPDPERLASHWAVIGWSQSEQGAIAMSRKTTWEWYRDFRVVPCNRIGK